MNSPEKLVGLERCGRIPFWSQEWKPHKLKPVEMLQLGVRAGLLEHTRSDFGEVAGEEVYGLGSDPGIESKQYDQHGEVVHLAALADVITSAIRRPGSEPWLLAPDSPDWRSGCYLSPDKKFLRRVAFLSNWSDDRHYSECRSWETLGEIVHHGLPMQLVVAILGKHLDGKYHSYWTHGLRHPANKKLRFRKRQKVAEGFKESWMPVWREDFDDISTEAWLQGMLDDHVLEDSLLRFDIPVPRQDQRERIAALAGKKLTQLREMTTLPDQNLSTCDWPVRCRFLEPCHSGQQPSQAYGFVRIDRTHSS